MQKRSKKLTAVCALILFILFFVPIASADWIMFGADPSHTFTGTGDGVRSCAMLWNYTTGGNVRAAPAIAEGVVFAPTTYGFYALNASTGNKVWWFSCNPTFSSPAVVNGIVYFGAGEHVWALNTSNGNIVWDYWVQLGQGLYFSCSPTVANGIVYIGNDNGNVYALNATEGTKIWSYPTGGFVMSCPAVFGGIVYVGSYDNNLYALNATTGNKLWSYTTGGYINYSPAVAEGVVYVPSHDGSLYALNSLTGNKLWSYSQYSYWVYSPAVSNGVIYFPAGSAIYALNVYGEKLWSTNIVGGGESLAIAGGAIYFGSASGFLYALDALSGSILWKYTGTAGMGWPAVNEGVIYVRFSNQRIGSFCF
jgi:outer membrane protein assembly factor BamB